jgi:antirestriction protein ArdC
MAAEDRIQLPERELFADAGSYYATALHELVHWTGHPSRLGRELGRRFGDAAYAVEELIAEIGSAFLCAACRLEGRLQHAAYVAEWIKVLKADKRAVFTAAAKAQQAADYLQGMAKPAPSAPAEVAEAA